MYSEKAETQFFKKVKKLNFDEINFQIKVRYS